MDMGVFDGQYSKFCYELRLESPDEKYVAHMTENVLGEFSDGKVSLGSSIPLEERMVHFNNSKRLRECVVVRLVRIVEDDTPTNEYIAYLKPTNKEYICGGRIDADRFLNRLLREMRGEFATEWNPSEDDGYDGWLKA
jgi:hypothetical protein